MFVGSTGGWGRVGGGVEGGGGGKDVGVGGIGGGEGGCVVGEGDAAVDAFVGAEAIGAVSLDTTAGAGAGAEA